MKEDRHEELYSLSPTILSGTATSSVLIGPRFIMEAAGIFIIGPLPCIPGDLKAPNGSAAFAAAAAAAAATAAAILLASGSFSIDGLTLLKGLLTVELEPFLSKSKSDRLPESG